MSKSSTTTKNSTPSASPQLPSDFYAPKYWGAWIGIGFLRLVALLPHPVLIKFGKVAGTLVYHLAKSRRHVTRVNLQLCFPNLKESEREAMVKRTIEENVIGFFESACGWWGNPKKLLPSVEFKGLEHLQAATDKGGVLLVGAHYSNLDLGGILTSLNTTIDVTYRPHDNAVFNWAILKGRGPYFGLIIDRYDIRTMIRRVKQGKILWYAADQDYGPKHSVFAPFFGVPAATITGTTRLASMCKAPVITIAHHRDPSDNHYVIEFSKPLENFPTKDLVTDASTMNSALEHCIRLYPDQYMWVHRRFKTRPEGEKGFY